MTWPRPVIGNGAAEPTPSDGRWLLRGDPASASLAGGTFRMNRGLGILDWRRKGAHVYQVPRGRSFRPADVPGARKRRAGCSEKLRPMGPACCPRSFCHGPAWQAQPGAWKPAEAAHGDDEPGRAPGGQDRQVAPAQPGPCGVRVIRGKQGVRQRVHGEDLADIDQPVRQFQDRDEDTGEEAQRKDDGQGDRLGCVDVADEAGYGEAQAAEGGRADDDVEDKSSAGPAGDMRGEGSPADGEQDSRDRQG